MVAFLLPSTSLPHQSRLGDSPLCEHQGSDEKSAGGNSITSIMYIMNHKVIQNAVLTVPTFRRHSQSKRRKVEFEQA